MLTKEQQLQNNIWIEKDFESFNIERHNNGYTDMLIVDSPFGKQYFRWLETQRLIDKKIIRRID
jgi:hypothetical protein